MQSKISVFWWRFANESDFAQFQNTWLSESWLKENQIPFYAGWASNFIRFSNVRQSTPTDLNIQLFLDELKNKPKIHQWQIAQEKQKDAGKKVSLGREVLKYLFSISGWHYKLSGNCSAYVPTLLAGSGVSGTGIFYNYRKRLSMFLWHAIC